MNHVTDTSVCLVSDSGHGGEGLTHWDPFKQWERLGLTVSSRFEYPPHFF